MWYPIQGNLVAVYESSNLVTVVETTMSNILSNIADHVAEQLYSFISTTLNRPVSSVGVGVNKTPARCLCRHTSKVFWGSPMSKFHFIDIIHVTKPHFLFDIASCIVY